MKIEKDSFRLYAITDDRWLKNRSLEEVVQELIAGGITCLQYRDKIRTLEEKEETALFLKKICGQANIPFIINYDVNLALKVHANGVHLGQQDCDVKTARTILGEHAIIGVSARTVMDATKAEQNGEDYLGSGAVFGTATKEDARFLGVDQFSEICRAVNIPVVVSQITNAKGEVVTTTVQGILDQLMPGLVPLLMTFACMALLKRKVNAIWIIFGLFAIGIICYALGIMRVK